MTSDPIAHAAETTGRSRLVAWLARHWAAAQRRRRIAATERALQALSGRELKDIGVYRGSIHEVATEVEDRRARRTAGSPSQLRRSDKEKERSIIAQLSASHGEAIESRADHSYDKPSPRSHEDSQEYYNELFRPWHNRLLSQMPPPITVEVRKAAMERARDLRAEAMRQAHVALRNGIRAAIGRTMRPWR